MDVVRQTRLRNGPLPWGDRRFVVVVAAVVLFGVLAPLAYLRQPLHVDESVFLVIGRELTEGATLYVDVVDHKPPGIFLVGALLSLLPVEPYVAGRLLVGVVHLVSAGLVFSLARHLRDGWTGIGAAGAYLAGAYVPHFDGHLLLTEPFCVVALLVATHALFSDRRGSDVLAGVALAVGVSFNQTVFLAGLVIVGTTVLRLRYPGYRTREYLVRTAREYAAIGSGFVAVLGGTLLAFASVGALEELLTYSVVIPLTQYATPFVVKGHLIAAAAYFPVWLLSLGTAAVVFYRLAKARLDDERLLVLALWLVVLGYPGATGFNGDHKLLFVVPAAAILGAVGLRAVLRRPTADPLPTLSSLGQSRRAAASVAVVVVLATLAPAVGVNAVYASLLADDDVSEQIESAEAIDERIDGAAYMLPFNNEVPYFAESVEPANTFLGLPYSDGLARTVIADLERHETPYVLVPTAHMADDGTIARDMGFFPGPRTIIVEYVEANYERTGTAGGFVIYERTDEAN